MILRIWTYTIMFIFAILLCTAMIMILSIPILTIISGITDDISIPEIIIGITLAFILYPAVFLIVRTLLKWRKDEINEIEENKDGTEN